MLTRGIANRCCLVLATTSSTLSSPVIVASVPRSIETDEDVLLIIKTRQATVESLTKFVIENHPYTVPEVVALPILGGNGPYIKWIVESTVEKSVE